MDHTETQVGTIACTVTRGVFSTERGVIIDIPGRPPLSAVVDRRDVTVPRDPGPQEKIDGRVRVYIVSAQNDQFVLDLPQPSVAGGTRFTAPRDMVDAP